VVALERILEKQNGLQMSQVFSYSRIGIRWFCFSMILARPLHPTAGAFNAILIPLDLADLRRGLASRGK
jgi:hypothetical protein